MVSVTHLILRFAIVQNKFSTNKQKQDKPCQWQSHQVWGFFTFFGIWPTVSRPYKMPASAVPPLFFDLWRLEKMFKVPKMVLGFWSFSLVGFQSTQFYCPCFFLSIFYSSICSKKMFEAQLFHWFNLHNDFKNWLWIGTLRCQINEWARLAVAMFSF